MSFIKFTLSLCLALVCLASVAELAASVGCADSALGCLLPRKGAYNKIQAFLEQREGASWEEKMEDLTRWYNDEIKGKTNDKRLETALGLMVKLGAIKSPESCTRENLENYLASERDGRVCLSGKRLNALERFVDHYRTVYDADCSRIFNEQFEAAISGIAPDLMAHLVEFSEQAKRASAYIRESVETMDRRKLMYGLNRLRVTKVGDDSKLLAACQLYRDTLSREFFDRVVAHSAAIKKLWLPDDYPAMRNGWVGWEHCNRFLVTKGERPERRAPQDANSDEESPEELEERDLYTIGGLYGSGVIGK